MLVLSTTGGASVELRRPAVVPHAPCALSGPLLDRSRPRADQAHLSAQHVYQLGQLVHPGPFHERPDPVALGVVMGLPETEHLERAPVGSKPAASGDHPTVV